MALTKAKGHILADDLALGGNPTTSTQSASDNSTKIATTAYVTTAVANLVDGAPSTLNTLNEIAAALNDDAALNTTLTNSIATKLPLAGGTMSGAINMGSQNITALGTKIESAGALTIDCVGQLNLDSGNDEIHLRGSGTTFGKFFTSSNDFYINQPVADEDIIFSGTDGSSTVAALTLDMSNAGYATFNSGFTTGSGNVGIGDSSPIAKLTVKAAADTIRAESLATDAKNITMSYHDSNDQGQIFCGQDGVVDKNIVLRGHTLIFQRNGGTEAMRIDTDGDINLVKAGTAQANLNFTTDGSLDYARITGGKSGSGLGDLRFFTYSGGIAERMRIQSDGAVVVNNSGGDAQIYLGGAGGSNRMYLARSSADTLLWNVSNGPIRFGTNNAEAYRIRPDGGLQFPDNNTFIATSNTAGGTAYEWGSIRRPAGSDGGQLSIRQYSTGDTAANYPAYAGGTSGWDENTGMFFYNTDQVGLTAGGNPTFWIEDGKKHEVYESGFTSGDANRGQRVCLGGISHIASTNPGGTGSGTYMHIKTNVPKSNVMFRFEYKGYSYDNGNMDTSITGYTYADVSYVYSPAIQDTGNTTHNFKTPYYSSDNKLVLVLQVANNYTGGVLWAQFVGSHTMSPGTVGIVSCAYSGSTSGAF